MGSVLGGYRREARGEWSLWLDETLWREEWWPLLDRGGEDVSTSRHARTVRLTLSGVGGAFLKLYHPGDWPTQIKDLLRPSKALRALRMSVVLTADDFHVARVLAAGEQRRGRYLERAFVLTEAVEWPPLGALAAALRALPADVRIARRRSVLAGLGNEVGRFHRLGYVHGDLVATNILAAADPPVRFCFLDHDRSRRGLIVGRRHQQRRNLIQLNRLILPGITHADRLRVFVGYASARGWDRARWRREARWLARRTLTRRLEIERLTTRRAEAGGAREARRRSGWVMPEFTLKQRGPGWRDVYETVLRDPARALAAPETVMLKRRDAGREVGLIVVGGVRLVVKLYDESGVVNLAERLLLSSAAARAARGIARMTAAGFRAPVLVAVLETPVTSRAARSCLVTEAVSGERADNAWPRLSRVARREFAAALGGYVRALHQRGVYPQDLWMTNLFAVRVDGGWEFVLVDVDRVRVYWRVSSRRRVKNLVQIERSLGRQARWAERLRFLRSYLGPVSRAELVRTAQAVLAAGHQKDVAHGTRRL